MERLDFENGLFKAIENEEFSLVYQPQLLLDSNKIVGFEPSSQQPSTLAARHWTGRSRLPQRVTNLRTGSLRNQRPDTILTLDRLHLHAPIRAFGRIVAKSIGVATLYRRIQVCV